MKKHGQGTCSRRISCFSCYILLQAISNTMGQEDTEIAFDLAIYVKAKEIQWRSANKFSEVVIRMGTFHIASNFFAIIRRSTQT